MTIPELEEGIRLAHKQIEQLRHEKHELAENLSELRCQLGIQCESRPAPCAPPSEAYCGTATGIAGRNWLS